LWHWLFASSQVFEFARQADRRDATIVICASQAGATRPFIWQYQFGGEQMKYGAVAVGARMSGTYIWNATKYRDQRSITTAKRCRLAGDPDLCRSLRSRLLSSVSLAVLVTTVAAFEADLSPALAQCVGTTDLVCTSGGNTYPGGINVNGGPTQALSITLEPGVIVDLPAGGSAVNAANTTGVSPGSANIAITADSVTINNAANPGGNNNTGLRIQSSGAATITATNTTIEVAGTASDWAILAFAMPNLTGLPHDASVTWSGPSLTSTTGVEGAAYRRTTAALATRAS
jgi:hypothetical protein